MNEHAHIEMLLAVYRDLSSEEQSRVDEHIKSCPACTMRLHDYNEVELKLTTLHDIRLSPRLARPLSDVLQDQQKAHSKWLFRRRLVFGSSFVSAGVVLLLLFVLSIAFWSISSDKTLVTATPTLTSTMTPTLAPAPLALGVGETGTRTQKSADPVWEPHAPDVPTPAPIPLPRGTQEALLLVAIDAHATIIP